MFPHAARFNHSCNPNACFSWNSAIGKETIHSMRDIKAGEEITISYVDMEHDKRLRAWELRHYGFVCDCAACGDEDDESTLALKCAENRLQIHELIARRGWCGASSSQRARSSLALSTGC